MINRVDSQFKSSWKDITAKVTTDQMDAMPVLKKWWPTISNVSELDWTTLTDNFLALGQNPIACLLHVFTSGMAFALECMDNESILPLKRLGEEPIPDWLTVLIYNDIIKKYGDEHYTQAIAELGE